MGWYSLRTMVGMGSYLVYMAPYLPWCIWHPTTPWVYHTPPTMAGSLHHVLPAHQGGGEEAWAQDGDIPWVRASLRYKSPKSVKMVIPLRAETSPLSGKNG